VLIFRRGLQRGLESAHKILEFNANRVADILEFEQIQSPRTRLVLTDERLGVTQSGRNISLMKPLLLAKRSQQG